MPLSALDLAYERGEINGILPDLCSVDVLTMTGNAGGGRSVSATTTFTGVPCRVDFEAAGEMRQVGNGLEVEVEARIQIPKTHPTVTLPTDAQLRNNAGNRVKIRVTEMPVGSVIGARSFELVTYGWSSDDVLRTLYCREII